MTLSKWLTEGAAFEVQYFSGLIFGLAALGISLWLMFKAFGLMKTK